jgi:membrane fusion protein (multidrug efflux system)
LDVSRANIKRVKAVIARKTMLAPFRARIGMSDVHVGQYLEEGTMLTTLQGVGESVHVDFTVAQQVAAGLKAGDQVEVLRAIGGTTIPAEIVAIDARVDPTTRNAWVRAKIEYTAETPAPGASVRVKVPVGSARQAAAIPVSALRRGPEGDHVFVIEPDKDGKSRAQRRPVKAGSMLGDEILVYSGLKPGEVVAASGSFKLGDGLLVAIANQAPPDANASH